MKRALLLPLLIALAAAAAPAARADDLLLTPKHLIIVRPGLEAVFGSYVFAVQNPTDQPQHYRSAVMLPKETDDFAPQEGLEPNELTLGDGGGVVVDKTFDKGVHIVSIGFRVAASYGKGVMTLAPVTDINSLVVLLPRNAGLQLVSPMLVAGGDQAAPDPQYLAFVNSEPLKAGQSFTVEVTGIPEGRRRIWIIGGIVAGLLTALAGFLAWRTRPKISEDAGQTVLTG